MKIMHIDAMQFSLMHAVRILDTKRVGARVASKTCAIQSPNPNGLQSWNEPFHIVWVQWRVKYFSCEHFILISESYLRKRDMFRGNAYHGVEA